MQNINVFLFRDHLHSDMEKLEIEPKVNPRESQTVAKRAQWVPKISDVKKLVAKSKVHPHMS